MSGLASRLSEKTAVVCGTWVPTQAIAVDSDSYRSSCEAACDPAKAKGDTKTTASANVISPLRWRAPEWTSSHPNPSIETTAEIAEIRTKKFPKPPHPITKMAAAARPIVNPANVTDVES